MGSDEEGRPVEAQLLDRRVVLVVGRLTALLAERVLEQLLVLYEGSAAPIAVHLASEDGELGPALLLADAIDAGGAPVVATARGVVGGAALAPYAAATRRVAAPSAVFSLSAPRVSVEQVADERSAAVEEALRQVDQLHGWLRAATGRPEQVIAADLRRGLVLDAREAADYGLVQDLEQPGR